MTNFVVSDGPKYICIPEDDLKVFQKQSALLQEAKLKIDKLILERDAYKNGLLRHHHHNSHSLGRDKMTIELPDYYEEWYPEHSRTSCSDEHPINAAVDGTGCDRCNAIRFAEHEQLRTKVAALEAEMSECQKDRDYYKANARCAMSYLSEIRSIVGGDDFPDMVKRVAEMLAALEKCKDPSIHAHIVAEKAIANVKEK